MSEPIHVEIPIRAPLAELWRRTQDPAEHARWDLRFTDIVYAPPEDGAREQRFRYETRVGFGLRVRGEGRTRAHGGRGAARASALRFSSGQRRSLIREGAGFWRYEPRGAAVRFLTRYDYRVRWGRLGRAFDRAVFRPLFGWATAWSFDRLRLWLERGVTPERARRQFVAHALARLGLGAAWIWQGLVPKLLAAEHGELALAGGLIASYAPLVVALLGLGEIGVGLACLFVWDRPRLWTAQLALLPLLTAAGLASEPAIALRPFGPVPLTLAMLALAAVGHVTGEDLPLARRARRAPEGRP